MRSLISVSILLGLALPQAHGAGASDPALHSIPQAQVAAYLEQLVDLHTFDAFEGQNEALKAAATDPAVLQVAAGFPVAMGASDLFAAGLPDGDGTVYLAGIVSVDAEAIRLLVDLAALGPDDELWVIDPTAPRAFGPYGAGDYLPGGRWLPTVMGDMAVLMVRSSSKTVPGLRLEAVSHFYWDLAATKADLECHLDVTCEEEAIRELATGIGFMVVPYDSYDQAVCSGCLLDSVVKGPYFLTANHCVPRGVQAWNVDVVWDYRTDVCDSNTAPSLSALPRSAGVVLLATDGNLDGSLLLLDQVPGPRTYLSWDTRAPVVGEDVMCIHHPAGYAPISTHFMRIAKGHVQEVDTVGTELWLFYEHETRVLWDEGATETGSSGSCLLFQAGEDDWRVAGMLSGGTNHVCGPDRSNNYDYYASFRHFYPDIEGYLTGTPPDAPENLEASDGTHAGFVRVTWDIVPGATGYLVYRSPVAEINGQMVLLDDAVVETTYDDVVAGAGCFGGGAGEYYYWVRATNEDGDSAFSTPDTGYSSGKSALMSLQNVGRGSVRAVPSVVLGDGLVLVLAGMVLGLAGRRRLLVW